MVGAKYQVWSNTLELINWYTLLKVFLDQSQYAQYVYDLFIYPSTMYMYDKIMFLRLGICFLFIYTQHVQQLDIK